MYVVGISGMGEGSQKMDNSSDKVDNSPFLRFSCNLFAF